ncbi:hypothetical protein SAMN06297144_3410 [Sphingomonas guangdongensis]|uniref:Methyltransferase domain-containing protein n=1 Tax=Sphingomonas guangdongensis TaxID=1141890 RepID=A0A285R7A4_9SPHN|nr:class I SAM-dependent methyltransferase [Sphingomonas guangdongensis]SOB88262.1 hypothetical protein SAMN06297144_3410 [Sphingomonas guangdongensis]
MIVRLKSAAALARRSARSSQRPVSLSDRSVRSDPRWPEITATLATLRDRRRHAIRIVDADCGRGALLIAVARYARTLGFTAIEGRGIDGSPALIGAARTAAARLHDPAIGLSFECADLLTALSAEAELPADIVLWNGSVHAGHRSDIAAALAGSGDRVIGDPSTSSSDRHAA